MDGGVPPAQPEGTAAGAGGAPAPEPAAVSAEAYELVSAERDQYLDALQRLKAEFENYRKRVERDRRAMATAAVRDLVAQLLPVIDNLERAIEALGHEGRAVSSGVEMVRAQLVGLLESNGLDEIDAHGLPFDPTVHEAVSSHPTADHPEGTVVHVAAKGYKLEDTVVRPARVVVATAPPEEGDQS
jgi:molecular chaperone GrpE